MNSVKRLSAALAVLGIAALPAVAHAGVLVEYSNNNGATWTTICSSATNFCSGTVAFANGAGTVTINNTSVLATSTLNSSDLFSATTVITNTGGALAGLLLRSGGDGFLTPAFGTLVNNLAGTSITGNGSTATLMSCAVGGGVVADGIDCPGGISTTTAAIAIPSAGNFGSTTTVGVPLIATPFELGERLSVSLGSGLAGVTQINFSNSTSLTSVPEPTSLALLATGLVGIVGVARRRKTKHTA